MSIAEKSLREQVTTSTPFAPEERLTALLEQPTEIRVRGLVSLCRHLSRQYQETPETCLERSWWRLFNQAGICLREALDQARAEGYPGLSDQEAEQAYFLLIHVAYFFEPRGVAETLWPLLPAEPGDTGAPPATSEALGLSFGTVPQASVEKKMLPQVKPWSRRLGQLLGRNTVQTRNAAEGHELAVYGPPALDEVATWLFLEQERGALMARILVVEDEAPLRRIMVLNLVRRGHTLIEAESVAAAQEALVAFGGQFDLILLDLNLPDRTGWDVLRSLAQMADAAHNQEDRGYRQPPVIVVTAVRPVRSRLEEFHPAAVLLKPFPIEALLRLIQRVLTAAPAEEPEDADEQHVPPASDSPPEALSLEQPDAL